jgi:hypothetical protein
MLKSCWNSMRALQRKADTAERASMMRTGGGPPLASRSANNPAAFSSVVDHLRVEWCNNADSDGAHLQTLDSTPLTVISQVHTLQTDTHRQSPLQIHSPHTVNELPHGSQMESLQPLHTSDTSQPASPHAYSSQRQSSIYNSIQHSLTERHSPSIINMQTPPTAAPLASTSARRLYPRLRAQRGSTQIRQSVIRTQERRAGHDLMV